MLYIDRTGQDRLFRLAREGSVHDVRVIARLEGDRARISVDGRPFVARLPSTFAEGNVFKAVVIRERGVLTLMPQGPILSGADSDTGKKPVPVLSDPLHLAARLALPPLPVYLSLIAFYSSLGSRLDAAKIRKLALIATRFEGREEDAAEAAAMLDRQGVEPDETSVETLLSILRGEGGGGDGSPDDGQAEFLETLNGSASGSRWVIVPFQRSSGVGYAGSLRFLLDAESGMVSGMRIGAIIDGISVRCELSGESPSFSVNPRIPAVILEKTEVYFKGVLAAAGIVARGAYCPSPDSLARASPPLDVRA